MEGEFRAGPLQLLELGEVAQGLLRPSRPREQVRSGAQAPHTSGRQRPVAQEFFDGPIVFSQAVVGQGTPLDGGAEGGVDFECAIVVDQAVPGVSRAFAATARNVQEFAELGEADVLSYTPTQRKRAGDEFTQKHLDQGASTDPS